MAYLIAAASGNWTAAATWGVVDAASLLNSEASNQVVSTAFLTSSAFTPAAGNYDGVALKLGSRVASPTGTMDVELSIGGVQVAGTAVQINVADLPASAVADVNGGWIFFKFAAPVALAAVATNVRCKTSSANQVFLFRDATAANWSRLLRTTTTQVPAAGDDLVITGEKTGAGTQNTITVTMNETAATDYGSGATGVNGLVTPGLSVCHGGVLSWDTTASSNFLLRLSGHLIVYSGGIYLQGDPSGTAIPRTSTGTLEFDCAAADGDFGITVRNLGVFRTGGESRTSGKDIVKCHLNTDEAVNSTSLGVDTDTGWLDNDEIAIASTTLTHTQCEKGALNGNAGASTLTVDGFAGAGGGLAFAHGGGTADIYVVAEIILLTRNVRIRSVSSTFMTFLISRATAITEVEWTELYYVGGSTLNIAMEFNNTTGSVTFNKSVFHDGDQNFLWFNGSTVNNITLTDTHGYNCGVTSNGQALIVPTTSGTAISIDSFWAIRGRAVNFSINGLVELLDMGGTLYRDIRGIGSTNGAGIRIADPTAGQIVADGVVQDLMGHSNGGAGFTFDNITYNGYIDGMIQYHNNSPLSFNSGFGRKCIIRGLISLGSGDATRVFFINGESFTFISPLIAATTSRSHANCFQANATGADSVVEIQGGVIGQSSGIRTGFSNYVIILNGTAIGWQAYLNGVTIIATNGIMATTEPDLIYYGGRISVSNCILNGSALADTTWKSGGRIERDTTVFNTAAPSEKLIPRTRTNERLESQAMLVAAATGAIKNFSVAVRKDASYAGAAPRLILKADGSQGIYEDQVLDTLSVGASTWETLTGATPASLYDGAFQFVVDCTGTAGAVNIDDAAAV